MVIGLPRGSFCSQPLEKEHHGSMLNKIRIPRSDASRNYTAGLGSDDDSSAYISKRTRKIHDDE